LNRVRLRIPFSGIGTSVSMLNFRLDVLKKSVQCHIVIVTAGE